MSCCADGSPFSLVRTQDDIYMFGGKLEVKWANVTDELWVFNIPRRSWSLRRPSPPPPYALEGHTAHVVELAGGEVVMLTFFGYSPIYSYVNKVQEYDLSESTLIGSDFSTHQAAHVLSCLASRISFFMFFFPFLVVFLIMLYYFFFSFHLA